MAQQPPPPRSSQAALQVTNGFLTAQGTVKVDTYEAVVERLGTPGLKVVEAYSDSWGPCGSVGTLLKKFLTEASPPEGGLEVLVCKAEGNALLERYTQQSTPHFLFYRNGTLLQTIAGPNVPALEAALRAHCPKTGEVPPFGDDPALNKFTAAPAARPTTAGRPRTADLLRQSRSGSMAKSESGPRLSGVAAGPRLSGAAPHRPSVVVPAMADVEEES